MQYQMTPWKTMSLIEYQIICLDRSLQHAKYISLVMDRISGLVSPQFHVKYDNKFDTLHQERYESRWQIKARFASDNAKRKIEKDIDERKNKSRKTTESERKTLESKRRNDQKRQKEQSVKERNVSFLDL